uniref:Sema domain-containing protein n=1 Tax=Ascaris lumbricoides TaxID=6252 RepID=A0A0M3HR57_ASCLU
MCDRALWINSLVFRCILRDAFNYLYTARYVAFLADMDEPCGENLTGVGRRAPFQAAMLLSVSETGIEQSRLETYCVRRANTIKVRFVEAPPTCLDKRNANLVIGSRSQPPPSYHSDHSIPLGA